jgi:hypothetical protein
MHGRARETTFALAIFMSVLLLAMLGVHFLAPAISGQASGG